MKLTELQAHFGRLTDDRGSTETVDDIAQADGRRNVSDLFVDSLGVNYVRTRLVPQATDAQAVVAGVQWMPFPMIELRPEYRYLDTTAYRMAQYTLQVHLFY